MHTVCPHCGRANNHVTESIAGPGRLPIDGDYSICFGCWTVAKFINGPLGLATQKLTAAEEFEALIDPSVQEAMRLLREARG